MESFNGRLRDQLLNVEIFDTLLEAEVLTRRWQREHTVVSPRTRSALEHRPHAPKRLYSRARGTCHQHRGLLSQRQLYVWDLWVQGDVWGVVTSFLLCPAPRIARHSDMNNQYPQDSPPLKGRTRTPDASQTDNATAPRTVPLDACPSGRRAGTCKSAPI